MRYDTRVGKYDRKPHPGPGVHSGVPAGAFIGHLDGITFVDSLRDMSYFISNCNDQTTKLWDYKEN